MKTESVLKVVCPHCNSVIPVTYEGDYCAGGIVNCPTCGDRVRVPRTVPKGDGAAGKP